MSKVSSELSSTGLAPWHWPTVDEIDAFFDPAVEAALHQATQFEFGYYGAIGLRPFRWNEPLLPVSPRRPRERMVVQEPATAEPVYVTPDWTRPERDAMEAEAATAGDAWAEAAALYRMGR